MQVSGKSLRSQPLVDHILKDKPHFPATSWTGTWFAPLGTHWWPTWKDGTQSLRSPTKPLSSSLWLWELSDIDQSNLPTGLQSFLHRSHLHRQRHQATTVFHVVGETLRAEFGGIPMHTSHSTGSPPNEMHASSYSSSLTCPISPLTCAMWDLIYRLCFCLTLWFPVFSPKHVHILGEHWVRTI